MGRGVAIAITEPRLHGVVLDLCREYRHADGDMSEPVSVSPTPPSSRVPTWVFVVCVMVVAGIAFVIGSSVAHTDTPRLIVTETVSS